MVGTVQKISGLADENHEPLRNQTAMYANRLLKKPDQARSLCLVAHLFWHTHVSFLPEKQPIFICLLAEKLRGPVERRTASCRVFEKSNQSGKALKFVTQTLTIFTKTFTQNDLQASQSMDDSIQLNAYLHILSNYLHFYELGCSQVFKRILMHF